jgi:hypothetical protein
MIAKTWFLILILSFSSIAYSRVPTKAYTFDFDVQTHQKISRNKELKILRSLDLIREILASPEFRASILWHKYKGRAAFQYNNGLSNLQIYHRILEGAERLKPWGNNQMDLRLEFYTDHDTNVIAYTFPDTMKVWINNKFFYQNSDAKVAANLVHEWLHKLGFHHDRERTSDRKFSVPYGVGRIIYELARKR